MESILQLSGEGREPDPHIGIKKCRLFVKGYRGKSIVIIHKVFMLELQLCK